MKILTARRHSLGGLRFCVGGSHTLHCGLSLGIRTGLVGACGGRRLRV